MSDLFIGESDDDGHHTEEEDPLALSAHSDWEEDDSDTESGHKKPVSLATGRRLLDMITTAMKVFDEVAPAVAPNPYLSVAAPPQSGTYKVAGFARIRTRLAAEHRHIVECLGSDNLGNLRGNNVSALCLTVALMCTQADVSAAMFRVTVPDPAEEEEAAAQGGDDEESVVDDEAVAAVVAAPPTRPKRSVEVDLITDGGQKWVKVKASSATNFMREAAGVLPSQPYLPKGVLPEPGHAPFLDTLRLLLASAASQHYRLPFNRRPKIVVACAEEPPPVVRQVITDLSPDMEILVLKDIGCGPHAMFHERRRELQAPQGHLRLLPRASAFGFPVKRVNLDVTAMVAIVCDCCHGFAGHKFPKHHILQQQSTDEAAGQFAVDKYIAPTMNKFTVWGPPPADVPFGDDVELRDEAGESVTHPLSSLSATDKIRALWPTNWIAAKRAVEEFTWILDTIAGPHELIRAAWLLRRLTVLDDSLPEYSSASVNSLKNTNKIQDRHRAVFGLGDAVEAITVTGNRTFVQAAQEQGVSLLVQFHPSRALTERKRRGMEGRRNDTTGPPPSAVAARNAAAELRSTARGAAGQLGTENLQ